MEKRNEMKKTSSQIYKTSPQTRKWQRERERQRQRDWDRQADSQKTKRKTEAEREKERERVREIQRKTDRENETVLSECERRSRSTHKVVHGGGSVAQQEEQQALKPLSSKHVHAGLCTLQNTATTETGLLVDMWQGGGGGGGREASGIAKERQWGRRGMRRSTGK